MSGGSGGRPGGAASGGEAPPAGASAGGPPEAPRQPPAWRLVGTLGSLAAVAGLGIVLVHQWAQPRIEDHRARELAAAVQEVLGGPDRYETRWIVDGALRDSLPAAADSAAAARVYAGFDAEGGLLGYAVAGEKPGYQDVVRLIFGYDPRTRRVLGMKVLESKETPGLGAKIMTDSAFLREFEGAEPPLVGVKGGGGAPDEVDMITGATISSEAVVDIINARLRAVGPALEGAAPGGGP